MYDGSPSYLMYYSHKCPSYMWTSFVIEAMESFSRQNKLKRYCDFGSTYWMVESEVREYWEYGADWINGTGERETIDQGIDEIEGKDWNEGIRTMALMEFMKLMEPTQLMEGVIFSWFSNEIVGTYENHRIGVFFIDVMEFQRRNNQWHWRYSLN